MKLFLKIAGGMAVFFVALLIGLNLYFTDERLKNMILPEVRQAVNSDVEVERMSLTFFKTFPRFGVELNHFLLPDPDGEQVVSIEEVLLSVELFPLFRNELSIARLDLQKPSLSYRVLENGSSNIDFLTELADEDTADEGGGLAIRIPRFTITSGSLFYRDAQADMEITMSGLDAQLSLHFAELIETTVDLQLEALSYSAEGSAVVESLSIGLRQVSVLDLERETLTISEGVLSIRGLALHLSGSLADWSSDAPLVDLQFTSSSDNFGELLRLAPPEFDEQLAGLNASGALVLDGFVNGRVGGEQIPDFSLLLQVSDGYLQNPDLPQPIEDIELDLEVNNQTANLRLLRARAAQNRIIASGSLERPLEEDGAFSLQAEGNVNLATVASFYPIETLGVEALSGELEMDMVANGRRDRPEEASFDGQLRLDGGSMKYADVPRAIDEIQARVQANQDQITISNAGFRASTNRFSLSGTINRPLDEAQRRLDLQAGLQFDLATIKEFYPIDEDTLTLRGQLTAELTLNGQPDPERPELLLSRSAVELQDGYIAHRLLGRALEEISFQAEANRETLTLLNAQFVSGPNRVAMSGSITDYLTEDPVFDVTIDGDAEFGDIATYYTLEPWLNEITGSATMNLNAKGPAGDPTALALNGRLTVANVAASGDSLPFPVSGTNGVLELTPDAMNLEEFTMNYGSSDFTLAGRVQNYLGFLAEEHNSEATIPAISGSYHSRFLNMDELIDWEEERDPNEPIPTGLPRLTSAVTATIDRMVVLGVPVTDMEGAVRTTPEVIILDNARATMFEGVMQGKMEWQVPDPNRTNLSFTGTLDGLTARSFFRDTGFMGDQSTFHEHVSGALDVDIEYNSELDETLAPDLTTTRAGGTFGMTRARLQNHPIQIRMAEFLRDESLRNMAMDEWTAEFSIADTVMSFSNFRLTSDGIGLHLEGTKHLVTDQINYRATLLLPERFKATISSVISGRAADALQNEDGMMAIPIQITGTSSNPRVGPDTSAINRIIEERLRDGAGDVLRRLFGGN